MHPCMHVLHLTCMQEFTYGGCGGNANNYESSDACKMACMETHVTSIIGTGSSMQAASARMGQPAASDTPPTATAHMPTAATAPATAMDRTAATPQPGTAAAATADAVSTPSAAGTQPGAAAASAAAPASSAAGGAVVHGAVGLMRSALLAWALGSMLAGAVIC